MSRFLLDTHVWLWLQTAPERLTSSTLDLLSDGGTTRFLSAASAWEIAIKHRLGKLSLPEPPATYVPERLQRSATTSLAVRLEHALGVADLPGHHQDPFDRLLIAQARALSIPIVTKDDKIGRYDVQIVRA